MAIDYTRCYAIACFSLSLILLLFLPHPYYITRCNLFKIFIIQTCRTPTSPAHFPRFMAIALAIVTSLFVAIGFSG